ncbi:hypothetical protein MIMGU_mgv1a022349mg, partial [Erythranthe guttata]
VVFSFSPLFKGEFHNHSETLALEFNHVYQARRKSQAFEAT